MTRRREIVYDKGKPVEVIHLSGDSKHTAPFVVGRMKGVELGYAGLGGTSAHNIKADTTNFWDSDVADRIRDHAQAKFRCHQLLALRCLRRRQQRPSDRAPRTGRQISPKPQALQHSINRV